MKVYLFRHGEVHNPDNVLYGRLPGFHLSMAGKAGVRASAERLPRNTIRKIYTSPLERARETSEIIREVLGLHTDDVIVRDDLIEVDCRQWEGEPKGRFLAESDYLSGPDKQTATEPILDAGKRTFNVLNEAADQGDDVVVVSHGDPIAGTLVAISGDWGEFNTRYPRKGSYTILEYSHGKWYILR